MALVMQVKLTSVEEQEDCFVFLFFCLFLLPFPLLLGFFLLFNLFFLALFLLFFFLPPFSSLFGLIDFFLPSLTFFLAATFFLFFLSALSSLGMASSALIRFLPDIPDLGPFLSSDPAAESCEEEEDCET